MYLSIYRYLCLSLSLFVSLCLCLYLCPCLCLYPQMDSEFSLRNIFLAQCHSLSPTKQIHLSVSVFLVFFSLSLCFFSPSSIPSYSLPFFCGLKALVHMACVNSQQGRLCQWPLFLQRNSLFKSPARLCPLPWARVMDGGNYGQRASIRALPAPGTGGPSGVG